VVDAVDIQAAVDRLASAVGQSVLIEDRDQRPLWWSTHGEVDSTRMKTIVNRRVDPRAAAVVREYKLTRATAPVRTPAIPEAEMWARWCMPLHHDGRHLGFLWVLDPDSEIGQDALPAIMECAELAAEALAKDRQATEHDQRLRDELLARLLEAVDPDAARELARLEHLPHDARVQVEAPAKSGGWPLPVGMSAHIAKSRARAATSGAPLPLVELGEAARRAAATRRALAGGAQLTRPTWDALGGWRLVVEAPPSVEIAHLHPAAEVLVAQARADLTATARVVLDHGGDVTAAAQALHLHRTTLYYRIDRIAELTGVDLRDGRDRTDLQLALWLAAYRSTEA
jgi:transcriptional regulator with GAF, ATPase, and Fis domain